MLTLKQFNLTENDLGEMLNFIYENTNPVEASLYAKFISEDATLEQKLKLLEAEGVKTSFDAVVKMLDLSRDKCCSVNESDVTWKRLNQILTCKATHAKKMVEVIEKLHSKDSDSLSEWKTILQELKVKVDSYKNQFKK